jgi:hypothetical protein
MSAEDIRKTITLLEQIAESGPEDLRTDQAKNPKTAADHLLKWLGLVGIGAATAGFTGPNGVMIAAILGGLNTAYDLFKEGDELNKDIRLRNILEKMYPDFLGICQQKIS